jgi:hypothetical protein
LKIRYPVPSLHLHEESLFRRVACPWLIKKFVDKDAEFVFVPPEKVMDEAKRLDAIPYDVKNVELAVIADLL